MFSNIRTSCSPAAQCAQHQQLMEEPGPSSNSGQEQGQLQAGLGSQEARSLREERYIDHLTLIQILGGRPCKICSCESEIASWKLNFQKHKISILHLLTFSPSEALSLDEEEQEQILV